MSVEEEVELKDLVAQTLELNGCLPKIRAQLRASLFLALDEDSKISKQQPMLNTKIQSHLEVPEGQLMFSLVREFLEYFELDFTTSVYEPESYLGSYYKYEGRQKIMEDLGLKDDSNSGPILLQLVKLAQTKSKTLNINLRHINDSVSTNGHITEESSINNKISNHIDQVDHNSTFIKKDYENDDTFNGTSSIEEESVDSSPKSDDKTKSSKSEKLKKLELPPLQINKARGSDLLPSLYSKDFREKTNRDCDFEFKDNYEEDFMSGSDIELSQNKTDSQ